jgi:hypothetical protein
MNKKRKILTMMALVAFGVITALHYTPIYMVRQLYAWTDFGVYAYQRPFIADVHMPLFVLGVFYVGLFFIFAGEDADPLPRRPRNWRRIIGVIFVLLVAAGTGAGMIYSYEQERQRENIRRSKQEGAAQQQEWEDSKHRITLPELKCDFRANTSSSLIGSIQNGSATYNLTSMHLLVTLYEVQPDGGLKTVGDEKVYLYFDGKGVRPGQTHQVVDKPIHFPSISSSRIRSRCVVTDIRASKG